MYTNNSFDLLHSAGQDLQLSRGKGHMWTSRSHAKVPHLTHSPPPPHSHTKDSHSTGITLLFSNSAWVLLRPIELSTFKELWDGTSGLSSLSEKTRKSNRFTKSFSLFMWVVLWERAMQPKTLLRTNNQIFSEMNNDP